VSYRVRLAPAALKQLDDIKDYITAAGSPETDTRYVEGIADFCDSLSTSDARQPRDDLIKGLRVSGCRRQGRDCLSG
jgi:plasmid stabilization system protein ParE